MTHLRAEISDGEETGDLENLCGEKSIILSLETVIQVLLNEFLNSNQSLSMFRLALIVELCKNVAKLQHSKISTFTLFFGGKIDQYYGLRYI